MDIRDKADGGTPLNCLDASAYPNELHEGNQRGGPNELHERELPGGYPNKLHGVNDSLRWMAQGVSVALLRTMDQTLVILPGIPGHSHKIDGGGRLVCGCSIPQPPSVSLTETSTRPRARIRKVPITLSCFPFIVYAIIGLGCPLIYAQEIIPTVDASDPRLNIAIVALVLVMLVWYGSLVILRHHLRPTSVIEIANSHCFAIGDKVWIKGRESEVIYKTDTCITVRPIK